MIKRSNNQRKKKRFLYLSYKFEIAMNKAFKEECIKGFKLGALSVTTNYSKIPDIAEINRMKENGEGYD